MLDPVQPIEFENGLLDAVFVRHGFEESAQKVLGGLYDYYRCYAVALLSQNQTGTVLQTSQDLSVFTNTSLTRKVTSK